MNRWLLISLLLGFGTVRAQAVYESFEVDKVCEPQGGQSMLQLFIQSNLNVPIRAQADRIKGRVFVSGVVEPDGKISSLSVTRGLRPDCNREALRVLNLFNAWVPARKDGQPVRQHIIYPVTFTPGSPVYVQEGSLIEYFTKAGDAVADTAATVFYRQTTPVDTLTNLPTGDRIVYERNGSKWKEVTRFQFTKAPTFVRAKDPARQRTQLIFMDAQGRWSQTLYTLYPGGTVALKAGYDSGKATGDVQEYATTGMLTALEAKETTALGVVDAKDRPGQQSVVITRTRRTDWYPNGQLKSVEIRADRMPGQPIIPTKLLSQWDSTGTALVTEGTGRAVYRWMMPSRLDDTKKTLFVETGDVRDGLKQGSWTGSYADGSYEYTETYEVGICQRGSSKSAGKRPFEYNAVEENPEPTGGMSGLSQYLAQSLRYPADAQRAGLQGMVFVSFIANTDGSIQDVQLLKGISDSLNDEAIRVVSRMPKWKPGKQRGEPARVKFNLPISFALQ